MYSLGSTISGSDQDPPDRPDIVTASWEDESINLAGVTADTERVRAVWMVPGGIVREEGENTRRVEVTVAMLVSDRRVLFAARGDESGSPSGTYSLAYSELAGVEDGEELLLTTTDGVVWRVPTPESTTAEHETVLNHLLWIGGIRNRLVSCRNDVELAAGEIREHATALDWDRALSSYEEVRDTLDRLICDVQLVEPVATSKLAPELTRIERKLERAHTRLYIERTQAALAMGRHLIEHEEYEQAQDRLRDAQRFYDRARAMGETIRRGDAFQFGPQRELEDDLENLGWELETVAAEPIRQAHEAKIEAQFADDPEDALEQWETAFRRYGHVLTLEWDDDGRNFAGNPTEVRHDRAVAAERIVELRQDLARELWNTGAEHESDGEFGAALTYCSEAVSHLERVLTISRQSDVADPGSIEGRLDRMRDVVDRLESSVSGADKPESTDADPQDATDEELVGSYEDQPDTETSRSRLGADETLDLEEGNSTDSDQEANTDRDRTSGAGADADSGPVETTVGVPAEPTDDDGHGTAGSPSVEKLAGQGTHHGITVEAYPTRLQRLGSPDGDGQDKKLPDPERPDAEEGEMIGPNRQDDTEEPVPDTPGSDSTPSHTGAEESGPTTE